MCTSLPCQFKNTKVTQSRLELATLGLQVRSATDFELFLEMRTRWTLILWQHLRTWACMCRPEGYTDRVGRSNTNVFIEIPWIFYLCELVRNYHVKINHCNSNFRDSRKDMMMPSLRHFVVNLLKNLAPVSILQKRFIFELYGIVQIHRESERRLAH